MIDRPDIALPSRGKLGYAIEQNNRPMLMASGIKPQDMLRLAEENKPHIDPVTDNPTDILDCLDQRNQGACQGHSLALIFTICYWLTTGRLNWFSRGGAYYLSQRKDGISGDRGSTLSGGQWVATQHGLCLERDWPYPNNYDPSEPQGLKYDFKLVAAQPTKDWELIQQALDMGLPVQDGLSWNNELERSIATNYTGRGSIGGHSTTLWRKSRSGNYIRYNSWGKWDQDGCNENTPNCLRQQVQHSQSDHVIYAPVGMIYPDQAPIAMPV